MLLNCSRGMAYSGTLVVSGRATGIVVATGSETELGRINQLLAGVSALETPLLLQIKKFGYAITAIVLVVGALTFAYGRFVEGVPFVELRRAAHGQPQRDRPAPPGRRNPRFGVADLLRQDRDTDADGNDGRFGRHR